MALRCRIILALAAGKAEVVVAADNARQSQDRSPLARAVRSSRTAWTLGDCSGPRPESHLRFDADQGRDRRHPTIQAEREHALELSDHGSGAGDQQIHREQHLAQPQHQTASHGDVQAVARSQIPGETHRRGRPISESSRQRDRALYRREEPNSGSGSHPARTAAEERAAAAR